MLIQGEARVFWTANLRGELSDEQLAALVASALRGTCSAEEIDDGAEVRVTVDPQNVMVDEGPVMMELA